MSPRGNQHSIDVRARIVDCVRIRADEADGEEVFRGAGFVQMVEAAAKI